MDLSHLNTIEIIILAIITLAGPIIVATSARKKNNSKIITCIILAIVTYIVFLVIFFLLYYLNSVVYTNYTQYCSIGANGQAIIHGHGMETGWDWCFVNLALLFNWLFVDGVGLCISSFIFMAISTAIVEKIATR